jgi:hypothetical protein
MKGNEMRLVDVIEQCSLSNTPDEVIWQITKCYTPKQIDDVILIFLKGIDVKHQVPGKVIYALADISRDYKEYEDMTRDQQIMVISRLITYWHQMSCESRADLLL